MDRELLQVERGEIVLHFGHEQVLDGSALLGGRAERGKEAGEGVLWEGGKRYEINVCSFSIVSTTFPPSLPPSLPHLHDHLHQLITSHRRVRQLHRVPTHLAHPLVGQVALRVNARIIQKVDLQGGREGGREGGEDMPLMRQVALSVDAHVVEEVALNQEGGREGGREGGTMSVCPASCAQKRIN